MGGVGGCFSKSRFMSPLKIGGGCEDGGVGGVAGVVFVLI